MTLSEQIEKDYIAAYKAKEATRLSVLRLLKTAAKNQLVALLRHDGSLTDEEMMAVIIKQGKQRQDSIEQYTTANRPDLAEKEAAELAILQSYLPKPLEGAELAAAIEACIAETGATSPKEMGKVMSALMAAYPGRLDGKVVSAAVRQRLM